MKVLDVTEFYSERGGGVRSHLSLKQHELCQRGHEHVVVAPGGIAREESALAHLVGHARVIRVAGPAMPYDPTYHFLVRVDKIHAIFKAERPDILEIHSPYVAALAALTAPKGSYRVRTFQWHSDFIDTYAGTLQARVSTVFAQSTWDGVWSDTLRGSAPLADYNDALYPIATSNAGAYPDRILVKFTSSTAFQVIGENLGLIAVGDVNQNCAPVNSLTGETYFTLDYRGWGAGWATGNCLRFNLIGAAFPVDLVRAIQPSTPSGESGARRGPSSGLLPVP
mgnify:CR=1 FL=1